MENIKVGLKGSFTLIVEREDGSFDTVHKDNIIVDQGFDFIADSLCLGAETAKLAWIGIGTNGALEPTNAARTTLGTENVPRASATYAHTASTRQFTLEGTFTGRTAAITEAGIFTASTAGKMFDRVVFGAINLQPADTLTAKFTLTMS